MTKRIEESSLLDIPTQTEIERKRHLTIILASIICFFAAITLTFALSVTGTVNAIINNMPDADAIKTYKRDQTTIIYDINNKQVANIHGDEDRVIVPLDKISPNLQRAVISIEDNRFYSHKGLDLIGTLRAASTNLGGGDSMQGGSTLTQQLVKNTYLSPERSIKRKLIEAILAIEIEKNYSKKEILEMYLNQIYWGNMCYGAEKAARRYFRKPASRLDLAESALLAGLLKAPEGLSPYTNFKMAKLRQKLVLERMEHYGYITKHQRKQAEKEELKLASHKQTYSKYSYFISYVSYLLRRTYGEEVVKRGGLRVYTTLDPAVQGLAEKVIKDGVSKLPKGSAVRQGALVSINNDNGYIQAMVGGVDYAKSNFNRAFQSRRAVGSSFKPVVYLTGFRLGKITPESPIVDAPISFNTGWNIWSPHNWDGKYMGRMNVRKALTLSRNTPTVRVGLKSGIGPIIETARALGIKSPINRDYSIVLGSLGVSPLELATVYSTLARNGIYIEPIAIRKVEDSQENILEEHVPSPIQVVSPNFVKSLNSILVDVVEKGTGKSAKLDDRQVAGKTGTTDDVKDIWFNGFTPDTTTIVWLGNDSNTKLNGVFSSNCAELWGKYSKEYYKIKKIPPRLFSDPVKLAVVKSEKKKKPEIKERKKSDTNNIDFDEVVKPENKKEKEKPTEQKALAPVPVVENKIQKPVKTEKIKPKKIIVPKKERIPAPEVNTYSNETGHELDLRPKAREEQEQYAPIPDDNYYSQQ